MADVRETSTRRWPAGGGPHRRAGAVVDAGRGLRLVLLALLALGAALGLWLWGRWGFLIAFDAIRAYCF
jgi:hypothetical protein